MFIPLVVSLLAVVNSGDVCPIAGLLVVLAITGLIPELVVPSLSKSLLVCVQNAVGHIVGFGS